MQALTLHQPWATLMALGLKKIETRGWGTLYRGPLAITAAAVVPAYAKFEFKENPSMRHYLGENLGIVEPKQLRELPLGAVVAVVDLVDCFSTNADPNYSKRGRETFEKLPKPGTMEYDFGNYARNRYAWITTHLRAVPMPVPCRGLQQLWTLPDDVERRVMEQLS
jgi:activating signal cointegrator 1